MGRTEIKKGHKAAQAASVVIYALTGAACGILFLARYDTASGSPGGMLLALPGLLVGLYAAMIVQIVIHEAGHLVFGLATGYRFVSFRVFSLMWVRLEGRIRLRRFSLAGTGGQCIMGPPDLTNGSMPVLLYNFGGAIFNALSIPVFLGVSLLFPGGSYPVFFCQIMALIGAVYALMNGVPWHMGLEDNDGMNAVALRKSPAAVRAFWTQLKATEQISRGVRLREMPEEWFFLPGEEGLHNSMEAACAVLYAGRLMDSGRLGEAGQVMEKLCEGDNAVAGLHRGLMRSDLAFLEILGENRREVIDSLLGDREQQQLMKAMRYYPSVLRTQYACALLAEGDREKAGEIRKRFERAAAGYPYPCEIEGERELMAMAEAKAGE